MSEPSDLNGPQRNPEPARPPVDPADDLAFHLEGGDPPTVHSAPRPAPLPDNSPTIISRMPRAPGRPDETLSQQLRGRKLAHFELQEAVGVGGMAAVISAQDTQLERRVALKILPPQMAADPESIKRFHQEARSAARLDHENIARVFFCGEDQGLHFIAFEFVEGENLRMVLERRGRLPVPEAIHYLLQVATGLAHASARGVVHRDIKPSNIIITPTGRAKLVDMGLARSLGPSGDGDLTQSGVTLGTFDYISPEQALEPRDADVRSDIYSLGCTAYHMLTGQPPVPEGTAAKKLHYHQHIGPVDPRQLNPTIPDDVAAVLSRMMAKEPRDRYQRPEHLVQHLLQLAQLLGCATEVPEGVLFVDAPLHAPPRARPVLVGVIAAAILVGFVALLGALPGSAPTTESRTLLGPPGRLPPTTEPQRPPPETDPKKGPEAVDPPPASPRWVTVRNVKDLAEQLKQRVAWVRLASDGVFDVRREEAGSSEVPGLVFRGEELILEPEDPNHRPTIRLKHEPIGSVGQLWAALTIQGGKATLNGIRFVVDATGTGTLMTSVCQRDGGSLIAKNCEFVQLGNAEETNQRHLASLLVPSPIAGSARPNVTVERCLFRKGDHVLDLASGAGVQLVDCAFGPHLSVFELHSPRVRERETEIALRHCSALLDGNSVLLHLDGGASCKLVVNNSIVSCPQIGADVEGDGAVLVRETGDKLGVLRYEAERRNVYHNLANFWVRRSDVVAANLDEFQREAAGKSDHSFFLTSNPWQSERPLFLLDAQPEKAFLLNLRMAELRQDDNPKKKLVGIEQCLWGPLYPAELPPVEDTKPETVRKTKIVNPRAAESGNGVYKSLALAVEEANPGDEILIQHNGLLEVKPVRLEKSTADLTIRPAPRYRPILTLGSTTDRDAALFRLHDGKLKLENLEFLLSPTRAEFKAQSVVIVVGDGHCSFKDCLVTLESGKDVPLAVVTLLTDPNSVMSMDPQATRAQVARITLDSSFVRGGGDFMLVRSCRPFTLEAEDSLVALDGSFLVMDGNPKEVPPKPAAQVSLKQVTTYLGEHLIQVRRDDSRPGLLPLQVTQAVGCLFHSGKGSKTLIHLDGIESDEQMRRFFSWGEARGNFYSGYSQMLDQMPPRDTTPALPPYDQEKWKTFTREPEGRFGRAKFGAWPIADKLLSKSWSVNFRVKEPAEKVGAPVEKLRTPSGEGDTPPAPPDEE